MLCLFGCMRELCIPGSANRGLFGHLMESNVIFLIIILKDLQVLGSLSTENLNNVLSNNNLIISNNCQIMCKNLNMHSNDLVTLMLPPISGTWKS